MNPINEKCLIKFDSRPAIKKFAFIKLSLSEQNKLKLFGTIRCQHFPFRHLFRKPYKKSKSIKFNQKKKRLYVFSYMSLINCELIGCQCGNLSGCKSIIKAKETIQFYNSKEIVAPGQYVKTKHPKFGTLWFQYCNLEAI